MNRNNHRPGNEGPFIRLSARPSIHSHPNCPFANPQGMGAYGLNVRSGQGPSTSNDKGRDEVDNVQSKFIRPLAENHVQRHKRNSFVQVSHPLYTDDSSDDVLAKSLPASLPSYSSNEFDVRFNNSAASAQSASSLSNGDTPGTANRVNQESSVHSNSSSSLDVTNQDKPSSEDLLSYIPIIVFTSVLVLMFSLGVPYYDVVFRIVQGLKNPSNYYDEQEFYKDINELGGKYRVNDNSILQIRSGISSIFARHDTGSFIFVYKSDTNNFNRTEFNNFMNAVASTAARYLRNNITSVQPTVINSADLRMLHHSELIVKYRANVTRTGVLLVHELDRVPPGLAMAFHYYCDEYNPLVEKSAIFFTLDLAKCSNSGKQHPTHDHIEKCLTSRWSSLPEDNISPLLTRVVSVVVDVISAF